MKKIKNIVVIVLILLVISGYNVYATETVTIRYGGNKSDYFQDVIVDNNNNIVAVGTTASTDIQGLTNIGEYDGIIVKYDQYDSVIWEKNYGTEKDDSLNSIISVDDGYIIVGYKNGSKKLDDVDSTAVILKIDKSGNVIWEKEYKKNITKIFGKEEIEVNVTGTKFKDVEQTEDGNYIVAGTIYTEEDISIPVLVRYDSKGNIKLEKELTDYETCSIKKIILSQTNEYTLLLNSSVHSILLNLNQDGVKNWANEYTLKYEYPMFEDGILTTSGTYLIVGGNLSTATISAATSQDLAFILEYDKDGKLITENVFEKYKQSRFNRVIEIENRYVIIGQFANFEIADAPVLTANNFDVKVLKFDYNKNLVDEVITGVKSAYTFYNDSFSVAKLTDNDYYTVVNLVEVGSMRGYDALIIKTKNVFEPEADKEITKDDEQLEIPEEDIIIDNNQQIEVPDTLDNPSVIALAVGILLIFGGVILYFGILKSKFKKS